MNAPTYRLFAAPNRRRIHLGWWEWRITDGLTPRILLAGHALTEWGAHRKLDRALKRCEPVRHHIVRIEHPPLHPLSLGEVADVSRSLRAEGVQVFLRLSGSTVVLCPTAQLTTWEQVHAMSVVKQRTDATVRWSKAVA